MIESPESTSQVPAPSGWLQQPSMRYPDECAWFVLFSGMDVMMTWLILAIGGTEANPIAEIVIDMWGLPGAIGFKFSLTLSVIMICEAIARQRAQLGQRIMYLAIAVSAAPVLYSFALLAYHVVHI